MRIFFGIILSPIFYTLIALFLILFHPIQWLCYRLFGYVAHKRSVDVLNFCLTYCNLLILIIPKSIQTIKLPKNNPLIFVANHQSTYDIPGLIYFFRKYHAKFISKIELVKANIPSISYNLKVGGGANIERTDNEQSIEAIKQFALRMKKNNWSAFIFPEGTRTKNGAMKNFKVGGIATLLEYCPNATIVPIAIKGSWEMTKKGSFPLLPFNRITWTVLNPIERAGKTIEEMVSEAENAIRTSIA